MRSLWNGSVGFGLVTIPIRLYAATEKKDVKFNYLHEVCQTPVRYQKMCPSCGREVQPDEIVWGYEYQKGRYVALRSEDFESLPSASQKRVEITDFVRAAEIDPIFFDKTYFLEAGEGGLRAYALLYRSLTSSGRVAIGRVAIRSKEVLSVIRPYSDGILCLTVMYYPDEVRGTESIERIRPEAEINPREMEMALQVVESMSAVFSPERYENLYRRELIDLIESRTADRRADRAGEEPGEAIDLVEALRRSLKRTETNAPLQ